MKRLTWLLAGVLALGIAVPAMAGEGKCDQSVEACLAYFASKADTYGWVGIELDRNDETGVMTVTRVVEESPAVKAGFKEGDILIALNGVALTDENKEKLKEAKGDWTPGTAVIYTVEREGTNKDLEVTLAKVPRDVLAQWIGNHMLEAHVQLASTQ